MQYDSCRRILKAIALSLALVAPSLPLLAQENGAPGAGGPNFAIYPSLLQNSNVWKNQNGCKRTFLKDSANITPPALNCSNFWLVSGGSDIMRCPSAGLIDGSYISFHIQQGAGAPYATPFSFATPCYGWTGLTQPTWCATPGCVDRVGCQSMVPPDVTGASFICSALSNVGPPNSIPVFGNAAHTGSASSSPVTVTISTVASSGVLVLYASTNNTSAVTPTVASTTLGSWGAARASQVTSSGAFDLTVEFTKPFTSKLTSEVVTLTEAGINFATLDVFEVENAPSSSYFDPNGALPSQGTSTLSLTTSNANDIIYCGYTSGASSPTPGTGWTQVGGGGDFQIVQYKLVTTTQSALSCPLGSGSITGGIGDAIQ